MRAQSTRRRVTLLAAVVLAAVASTLVGPAAPATADPGTAMARVAETATAGASAPLDSVLMDSAVQTKAAAAGWVHVDTYPSLLMCHIVAAAYHSGRPHRCEFWWFLWQLWVYK